MEELAQLPRGVFSAHHYYIIVVVVFVLIIGTVTVTIAAIFIIVVVLITVVTITIMIVSIVVLATQRLRTGLRGLAKRMDERLASSIRFCLVYDTMNSTLSY